MNDWQYQREKRIVEIFFLFLLGFSLLFLRLSNLQVFNSDFYSGKAAQQQVQTMSLEIVANDLTKTISRGNFYDRRGESLLDSKTEERVIVFPQFNKDFAKTAFVLAQVLNRLTVEIENQIKEGPVILPYSLSPEEENKIKLLNLEGVIVAPVIMRYGAHPLAVNLIGHLKDGFENPGRGLEARFNDYLKSSGSENSVIAHVNAKGELIPGLGYERIKQIDSERRHVVLTIDSRIQRIAEEALNKLVEQGAVVVMDTATGDVLASASRPTYDPTGILSQDEYASQYGTGVNVFKDRTIEFSSPGSVFKILVAAAALEEKIADVDTVFYCNHDPSFFPDCNHGRLTLSEALAKSCNNTFAKLGLQLGKEKLLYYAKKFDLDNQNIIGYGSFAGSGFIEEILKKDYTLVNASIGQGDVQLSPIQVTGMVNTIANGGVYRRPRIVQRVVDSENKVFKTFNISTGERLISFETAEKIHAMLRGVTLNGTGKEAYLKDYGSAGKTGTAEVNKTLHSWFSGYAPVNRPRFVVTVLVEKGKGDGIKATKVFKEIMEKILEIEVK